MKTAETHPPKKGDWVQVWAQVEGDSPRPEDLYVSLASKSDHYEASVRRDLVEIPDRLPPFATQCTRLFELKPSRYVRCILHEGHNLDEGHLGPKGESWSESDAYGYIEER